MSAAIRYSRSGYGSKKADFDILGADGGRIASTPYERHAARIVACVNYCEGKTNAQLAAKTGPDSVSDWERLYMKAAAERDAMILTLKEITETDSGEWCREKATAALEALEGQS